MVRTQMCPIGSRPDGERESGAHVGLGQGQIQNPFLTAQSTQIKSVISVPIKDFIHHYPRALFNDIPMVGVHFYDIPGSGRTFTTYPGRDALLRHTRVGAQLQLHMLDRD